MRVSLNAAPSAFYLKRKQCVSVLRFALFVRYPANRSWFMAEIDIDSLLYLASVGLEHSLIKSRGIHPLHWSTNEIDRLDADSTFCKIQPLKALAFRIPISSSLRLRRHSRIFHYESLLSIALYTWKLVIWERFLIFECPGRNCESLYNGHLFCETMNFGDTLRYFISWYFTCDIIFFLAGFKYGYE